MIFLSQGWISDRLVSWRVFSGSCCLATAYRRVRYSVFWLWLHLAAWICTVTLLATDELLRRVAKLIASLARCNMEMLRLQNSSEPF